MIFVDEARIHVRAGDGGQGCESFYKDNYTRYPRPDGGNGGRGGDVIFVASRGVHTLLDFKYNKHFKAGKGGNASSKGKKGRTGEHCIIRVPCGTILRDAATGLMIKDLVNEDDSVIVAKGGAGGKGNEGCKTPTLPEHGGEGEIDLELKLIADVGLIGFPNAGKSTFISTISRVKSKVANYPFTTKTPILGLVVVDEDFSFVIADLPGIIEGAHLGKGLGDRFLRHAERTKMLVHLIDMGGTEARDPLEDYQKLLHELKEYDEDLFKKPRIVVANKMDLPEAVEHLKRFKKKFKKVKIIPISAATNENLKEVIYKIKETLCNENFPAK